MELRGSSIALANICARQSDRVVIRHNLKFGLYYRVRKIVDDIMAGKEPEVNFNGSTANALNEFYGITQYAGCLVPMPDNFQRKGKPTKYYPRPKWHRAMSPIVYRLRYKRHLPCTEEYDDDIIPYLPTSTKDGLPKTYANFAEIVKAARVAGFEVAMVFTINKDLVRELRNGK